MPLISHPYDDSSAAYLGTAILTIACFLHLLNNEQIQRLTGHTSALGDTNNDNTRELKPLRRHASTLGAPL